MTELNTCGHEGCGCARADDSEYCSLFCQEANSNDATDAPCECGCGSCN